MVLRLKLIGPTEDIFSVGLYIRGTGNDMEYTILNTPLEYVKIV
jgi:hypothetical protein